MISNVGSPWIEKLANGKYRLRQRYKDPVTGRTAKTPVSITIKKNTRQAINEAQRVLSERIARKTSFQANTKITFREAKKEWFEIFEFSAKKSTLRAMKSISKVLDDFITEKTLLVHVDKIKIYEILEDIYYRKDYSFSYVRTVKTIISNVFEYAQNKGYINHNPSENLTIKKKQETLEQREKRELKYLELVELQQIIKIAKQKNERYALLIEFLALTGLRLGEALGLQIKNLEKDKIFITGTFDSQAKLKTTPKTAYAIRKVSLSSRSIEIIDKIILENITDSTSKCNPDDYIFIGKTGKPIFSQSFNNFLSKIDSDKHLTSHILRHTHIAMLSEKGVPLKAIMERVGHSDPKTTLGIYSHVTENMKDDIIDKLDDIDI